MTDYTTAHSMPTYTTTDLIADGIDNLRTKINAVSQATDTALTKEGARAEEAAKWDRGTPIAAKTDLNTVVRPGVYRAELSTITNLPGTGVWTVTVEQSTGTSVIQVAKSWNVAGKTATRVKQGSAWTAWATAPTAAEVTAARWAITTPIAAGTDMDTVTATGLYQASSASIVNLPEVGVWAVAVEPTASGPIQIIRSWNVAGKTWTRVKQDSTWTAWVKATNAADISAARAGALADAKAYTDEVFNQTAVAATWDRAIHQHELRVNELRARRPRKFTNGKAAVTIIFDHGTNKFKDIVLPALTSQGLTATLALNSQMYDAAVYAGNANENQTTWSMIKGWHDTNGIEIANHGRTHLDYETIADIRIEVENGRKELEANLPGVKIDTWVQTGLTGTKFGGFDEGLTLDRYYETDAGRIILDSHALATGLLTHPTRVYPLDGHPKIGSSGYWMDTGQASIDAAKAKVQEAITARGGVILRMHPRILDLDASSTTTAQLTDMLTYLKGLVDTGKIEVLTYRDWSLADAGFSPAFLAGRFGV